MLRLRRSIIQKLVNLLVKVNEIVTDRSLTPYSFHRHHFTGMFFEVLIVALLCLIVVELRTLNKGCREARDVAESLTERLANATSIKRIHGGIGGQHGIIHPIDLTCN